MDRIELASKAVYQAVHPDGMPWSDLTEEERARWRVISGNVVTQLPAPFFIDMAIKLPYQSSMSTSLHWHLYFGESDEEIEQAGREFVARMKELRGT